MKTVKRILNILIWSLVSLHIALLLAVRLSPVQSWLGHKVSAVLSETLGTQATVGRVELGLFNRLIIDDVCIPDLYGDTLLRAGRVAVKAELLPMAEGRISIASAQLFGVHIRLCQKNTTSAPNYQFILDALSSSSDTTANRPLDLRIGSLIVRNSSVSYDFGEATPPYSRAGTGPAPIPRAGTEPAPTSAASGSAGGSPVFRADTGPAPTFDPNHFTVTDISTHLALKSLTPDSLRINLKRLSLRERSGLTVEDFTARLEAGPRGAQLRGLRLQLPRSVLVLDTLDATYALDLPSPPRFTDDTGRRFTETLRYHAVLPPSTLTPADLTPLTPFLLPSLSAAHADDVAYANAMRQAPSLSDLPSLTLATALSGTANTVSVSRLNLLSSDGSLSLDADGSLDVAAWQLRVNQFDLSSTLLTTLKDLFPAIPAELLRLGDLHLDGQALRLADGHTACEATLSTGLGAADLLFSMDSGGQLSGHVTTDSLHLGRLLAYNNLGHIAADIDLGGTKELMEANVAVRHLGFQGRSYHDISIAGSYRPDAGNAAARLVIDDPALKATVDADLTATTLSNAHGHVSIDDFTLHNIHPANATAGEVQPIHIDHLEADAVNEGDHGRLRVSGDMGLCELSGQLDWRTLPHSLLAYVASKLPTLPGLQSALASTTPRDATATRPNKFDLHVLLTDTHLLQPLLGIPLFLDEPLRLMATVDDRNHTIDLFGQLPSFTYDGGRYRDLNLSLTTLGDTALCDASLTKLSSDGGQLALGLALLAAENNLNTSLTWNTNEDGASATGGKSTLGTLNAVAQLYANADGKAEAHVSVQPSQVFIDGDAWHIRPCDITYSEKHLEVDSFIVASDSPSPSDVVADAPSPARAVQHLAINGTATTSAADTLTADLKGLDIAYIQDLLDFHPVDFSGLLSGKVRATSLFGDVNAWADVEAAGFRFQDGGMGTLRAHALWNTRDSQIDIDAVADDGPTSRTLINGYISPTRSDIDLRIRAEGTSIEFCRSFTKSVFTGLSGKAHGFVELKGPLGDMNLTGLLTVDGQTTVTALNTTYTLHSDTVRFVPDDIRFDTTPLTDRDGHTATLSGGIHHQSLSNFTFDFDIDVQDALVYDFPTFGDGSICGTVRATGHADMHGRPGEVIINCDVTPQPGSTFAYNAANPNAVSRQEFITWGNAPLSPPEGGTIDSPPKGSTIEAPSGAVGGASDLRINFLINATPAATLRLLMDKNTGDYITLNGEGTIRATFHNKEPFQMFGTYTVDHGTYGITIQNIIKKNFTFQPQGTIVFGGDPYDAALSLQAVHTVNGVSLSDLNLAGTFASNTVRVNCLMNITGTPSQPHVDFDLEMPTVNSEEQQMIRSLIASEQEMNQQVLYLLGIGRFYTQGANNADAQQYGQTTLAMQSFLSGTISTQINEVLSQVIKSNDWNFGANISTGDEGWNNAEYEGMISGRLLDNRLLLNGQFGYRDNATTATPSFIGDFDLQYLLKRNGSLAVKVYNQTNDRYFTRSSLNTQGVGLVMKKDFDGLGELLRKKGKKPKKGKKE